SSTCTSVHTEGHTGRAGERNPVAQKKEGRTFKATRTTWVLLARPTAAEPCFIASSAYSTWKMRPCGELFSYRAISRPLHLKTEVIKYRGVPIYTAQPKVYRGKASLQSD